MIITGPSGPTQIRSLTIGALSSGVAELRLQPAGQLTVDSTLVVQSGGKLRVEGVASVVGGVTNMGQIELLQGAQMNGGALTNSGAVRGDGTIGNVLLNLAGGEVRAATGQRLLFSGAGHLNGGTIEVVGGEVEFTGLWQNSLRTEVIGGTLRIGGAASNDVSTGLITGENATLRFNGGLTNEGSLALSFGTSRVFGDVTNSATGVIAIAGNSQATFYDDVANGGLLNVVTGSTTVFLGALTGSGNMGGGEVQALGDLVPGMSPGLMGFGGNLIFGALSRLEAEIAGTMAGSQHDQVNIAGAATLAGTLDVVLLNPFFPTPGETFEIMTFASHSGEFATVTGDAGLLDPVTFLLPLYSNTNLLLFTAIPGDGNLNGDVEAGDYTIWANNFATPTPAFTLGDYNGDGMTDGADYTLWANNFGMMAVAPAGATAAVPEPSGLVLLVIGAIALFWRRVSR